MFTYFVDRNAKIISIRQIFSTVFPVYLSNNNPFGRITVDQIPDVMVDKDIHPGGTTRFTFKSATMQRVLHHN